MPIQDKLLNKVQQDIDDIFGTKFTYKTVDEVPQIIDTSLTYSNGEEQKGHELETCVLFVDIRNSVTINQNRYLNTKVRMYTSFIRGVLRAAQYHNGCVRNIIGDRVMIVFPAENCFKNAVDCAVSINHIASKIIQPHMEEFKVGIGIDYGKMRIFKVGLQLNGSENPENKNFVWIGEPANFASRLTDMANKEANQLYKLVKTFGRFFFKNGVRTNQAEEYLDANSLADRIPNLQYEGVTNIEVEKQETSTYSSILITDSVFEGLKKEDPKRNSIVKKLWKKAEGDFRGVTKDVYQANLIWITD